MSRMYIVTTLNDITPDTVKWIDYHLSIGVDKIFLYCEKNTPSSQFQELGSNVSICLIDQTLKNVWKDSDKYSDLSSYIDDYTFIKKNLNIEHCLNTNQFNSEDWFINLDVNEVLKLGRNISNIHEFIQTIANSTQVIINNFEIMPLIDQLTDALDDHAIFKKNPEVTSRYQIQLFQKDIKKKYYFTDYSIGKTLFQPFNRNTKEHYPVSTFAFHGDTDSTLEASYFDVSILNCPFKGFDEYYNYFSQNPPLSEFEFLNKNQNNLYSDSRELFKKKSKDELKHFFHKEVAFNEQEIRQLKELKLVL